MIQLAELQRIENILVSGKKPKGELSLADLETLKAEIENKIEAKILRYYQRIRERYDDAVIPARNGYCSACGMQIPPFVQQEIKRGIGFNYCATCGRIFVENVIQ